MEMRLPTRRAGDSQDGPCKPSSSFEISSNTGYTDTKPFPFFQLPSELREAVLRYLVVFPFPPHYGSRRIPFLRRKQHQDTVRMELKGDLYPMNLFLASRQMYEEAFRAWRIFNTFVWVVRTPKSEHVDTRSLTDTYLVEIMEVRHLVMRIVQVGDSLQLERDLFPLLRSLIEHGDLRYLGFEDFVPTTAMESLLDLLSHPYLKRASLRIDLCQPGYPASRWCPLHDYVAEDDAIHWGVSVKWREFRAACSRGGSGSRQHR
ncbi:uncharacterized protein B0I36DRAFT_19955 [Microdochium trichocladiopsis]|uniref:F-box domain-containing protein n=1 Tax=Microdochium trichocladiopsis TaxID=1682393 RepID=A0A9P8YJQ9_9PEZI|nr:uncharacterized protein B0I36DRAFT_19955 [Microdochium trichocladiopsis]KAH7041148.1 hypothetical protein B0I36DRAFT_19955 [Microdochium trichocladiopsis]